MPSSKLEHSGLLVVSSQLLIKEKKSPRLCGEKAQVHDLQAGMRSLDLTANSCICCWRQPFRRLVSRYIIARVQRRNGAKMRLEAKSRRCGIISLWLPAMRQSRLRHDWSGSRLRAWQAASPTS